MIAAASGAYLERDPNPEATSMVVKGKKEEVKYFCYVFLILIRFAIKLINLMLDQRNEKDAGINLFSEDDNGDLTIIEIPDTTVNHLLSRKAENLRDLEQEFRVVCFIAKKESWMGHFYHKNSAAFAIFGDKINRARAQLKVTFV